MKKELSREEINDVTLEKLRKLSGVSIAVVKDRQTMAVDFAETVIDLVRRANQRRKRLVIIMPVGPTGQWCEMADIAIRDNVNLSRLCIVQMDEYLTPGSSHVKSSDPMCFSSFVWRSFGRRVVKKCGFRKENWIVPDPADTDAVERTIKRWGGVDVAFAGIGLNGHLAFNEPPSASESWTDESFAESPTRIVKLTDSSRATNSIFGTGGDLGRVPDYAVSIGMKQILSAKKIHIFLDWHWQRFQLRYSLLGPVSRFFPASFVQQHKNVSFTVTEDVAEVHQMLPE